LTQSVEESFFQRTAVSVSYPSGSLFCPAYPELAFAKQRLARRSLTSSFLFASCAAASLPRMFFRASLLKFSGRHWSRHASVGIASEDAHRHIASMFLYKHHFCY